MENGGNDSHDINNHSYRNDYNHFNTHSLLSSSDYNRPKTGLGILILNEENKLLVGKRTDCNQYGIPGGYLEKKESWSEGASREIFEEAGIKINYKEIFPLVVYNALDPLSNYHNIAIVLVTKINSKQKQVKNMEPHKCEKWEWWDINTMFKNKNDLFFPNRQLIEEFPKLIDSEYLNKFITTKTQLIHLNGDVDESSMCFGSIVDNC